MPQAAERCPWLCGHVFHVHQVGKAGVGNARLHLAGVAALGRVAQGGFLELWRSERYDELRRAVNDEALMPRYCKHCMWFNRN